MKKLLALIVCALLAFTLASCVHTHTEVIDEAVAPTCTESGLTEGKHCSECGEVLVKQEIIPTGHVLANGKCENCDYTYSLGLKFTSNGDGTCYVSGIGTCSDTEVVIPETSPDGDRVIAIGESAFYYCKSLTSIEIPASVTDISSYAFYWCTSLSEIRVADGNTNYKDIDGNLYSYDGTELIRYAEGKTDYTFIIPTSVTSIGDGAFYNCESLTNIEIPASVTEIGELAFYNCYLLTSVTFAKGSQLTSIGDGAFYKCNSLTSIEIPAGVTSIGYEAFEYCTSLTSVTFAKGSQLTSIGYLAFASCTSLTSIVIPSSVTSIGNTAFSGCSLLTSIVIPSSVTEIGNYTFSYCSKLTDVYYTGTEAQWAEISIGDENSYLTNATIHYNHIPEE